MNRRSITSAQLLLGDEAVALGAINAGVRAAYGYPGTPSTEILETLIAADDGRYVAAWSTNEKAAYEQALGASMAGARAIVTMKHVGLNVAADPGMHSSQNEQDSRFYADYARTVCLEPRSQQEAYDMAREAFALSEEVHRPVIVRLVTRVAQSRALVVRADAATAERADSPAGTGGTDETTDAPQRDVSGWSLLPSSARRLSNKVVESTSTTSPRSRVSATPRRITCTSVTTRSKRRSCARSRSEAAA